METLAMLVRHLFKGKRERVSMEKELEKIRKILKAWDEHQKNSIAQELKEIGENISVADFAALSEEDKWKWYRFDPSDTVPEIKRNTVRRACYFNDAAGISLSSGQMADAIGDMAAAEWAIRLSSQADGEMSIEKARSEMARMGVMAKIANDPRQKEKVFIFECWQAWQKSLETYASKAAFAKDMIAKCEHLKSQKKVEDWCREWGKS